ncbi:MAG TPA: HAD family phosphatase [Solirubrobacteraceae bacterium]|nr:HAD family phosphatase [Solirubrobacteraceae bacterium]
MPADRRTGLLVDFGGVLTTNVFASFAAFCRDEGLPEDLIAQAFRSSPVPRDLLFRLELGQLSAADFEREFARAIGLPDDRAEGLAGRLFANAGPDDAMLSAVAAAKRAGVRTGLISNSWGEALVYDRERFPELFDGVVISHEVGMRKPDPAIYTLGAERIGLPPEACVFVDDLGGNLKPALALGMATVKHVSADETIPQLEELLGVPLR